MSEWLYDQLLERYSNLARGAYNPPTPDMRTMVILKRTRAATFVRYRKGFIRRSNWYDCLRLMNSARMCLVYLLARF